MGNESVFKGTFILYLVAGIAWVFFLFTTRLVGTNSGDVFFWAIVGSIIGTTGFILYDHRTDWGTIVILLITSIVSGFYFSKYGYWPDIKSYRQYPDNMLVTGLLGIAGGISIGSLVGGAIGYFLTARDRFFLNTRSAQNEYHSTDQFDAVQSENKAFDYDPTTFTKKPRSPRSNESHKLKPASRASPTKRKQSKPSKKNPALDELKAMIGLEPVKDEITKIRAKIIFDQKRKATGAKVTSQSMHMVFTGNSGTGKTTVARIVGQIFHELGVLKKPTVHEISREDLVSGYIGQTAMKTKEEIKKAIGGVLFIDEAYSLTASDSKQDFGREAVETLLKEMENERDHLVVIVAGYKDEMQGFLKSNVGLKSRFKNMIDFPDYTPDELLDIFEKITSEQDFKLTPKAKPLLLNHLTQMYDRRDSHFGNGRDVRNLFEACVTNLAIRTQDDKKTDSKNLSTITADDIPVFNTTG